MIYEEWTNKELHQGRLIRVFGNGDVGQVTVKTDPETGRVNWRNLIREIFGHLKALGWERFIIKSVEVRGLGCELILNLEASLLKDEAEAWAMYLGDVITLPPEY